MLLRDHKFFPFAFYSLFHVFMIFNYSLSLLVCLDIKLRHSMLPSSSLQMLIAMRLGLLFMHPLSFDFISCVYFHLSQGNFHSFFWLLEHIGSKSMAVCLISAYFLCCFHTISCKMWLKLFQLSLILEAWKIACDLW